MQCMPLGAASTLGLHSYGAASMFLNYPDITLMDSVASQVPPSVVEPMAEPRTPADALQASEVTTAFPVVSP